MPCIVFASCVSGSMTLGDKTSKSACLLVWLCVSVYVTVCQYYVLEKNGENEDFWAQLSGTCGSIWEETKKLNELKRELESNLEDLRLN